jgi:hypothetical protein
MVLDPAQAETIGKLSFTAAPKRAGPAQNIAGIPRAIDNGLWDTGSHPENSRTSFSFPDAVGAAQPDVNNSQLGGLAREEEIQREFHRSGCRGRYDSTRDFG